MNKRHKWYNEIVAWANGAEIECQHKTFVGQDWEEVKEPMWLDDVNYRIKPQPVIKKMYMHYDSIEYYVQEGFCNGMYVPQQMYSDNNNMSNHLEFTFIDGKLASVKLAN